MRLKSLTSVAIVALALPFMMATSAYSAPMMATHQAVEQSSNIVDVAVKCGRDSHYVKGHRERIHGKMTYIKGHCARNPRHH